MKYLVYLLLGLNLVFFAWLQMQPAPTSPEPQIRPLPADVKPLVLLSERKLAGESNRKPSASKEMAEVETTTVPTVTQSADEEPLVVEISPVCRTLGPLESEEDAAALRDQLSAQTVPVTLRQSETQAPSGYQVYLQAASSRQAARIVSGLEAAGMTDYFVGKRNRISLGIFSSKSKAQARLRLVRELGYDARLDVRYRTRKVYWIDIEEKGRLPEDTRNWEQQVTKRYPRIKIEQVSCE